MKFGGSSVANSAAMEKVVGIIRQYAGKPLLVVLSACSGVTDKLLEMIRTASAGNLEDSLGLIDWIRDLHVNICKNSISNRKLLDKAIVEIDSIIFYLNNLAEAISLLKEYTVRNLDSSAACGELLATKVFAYLCSEKKIDAEFCDARQIIPTDSNFTSAAVDFDSLKSNCVLFVMPLLNQSKVVITQGFIGSDYEGRTTTLGRGGSDYTAALLGWALSADEIQIWTDVDGVLTSDPRFVSNVCTVPEMTFEEIKILSFFGAKVLHPDTIKPAIDANIPIKVLNTFNPKNRGTLIQNVIGNTRNPFSSIIIKQNCHVVTSEYIDNSSSDPKYDDLVKLFGKLKSKVLFSEIIAGRMEFNLEALPGFDDVAFGDIITDLNCSVKVYNIICISGLFSGDSKIRNKFSGLFEVLGLYSNYIIKTRILENAVLLTVSQEQSMELLYKLHDKLFAGK